MNTNLILAKKLTEKLELPMKIISVEEDEEGAITFHFSCQNRVEMHELIKKLQEETKRKIIMHEIGGREEAKILAGVGPCGLRLCCASFLKTFPAFPSDAFKEGGDGKKIGVCGKPRCCLAFEEKKPQATTEAPKEHLLEKQVEVSLAEKEKILSPRRVLRVLPRKKPRHRR